MYVCLRRSYGAKRLKYTRLQVFLLFIDAGLGTTHLGGSLALGAGGRREGRKLTVMPRAKNGSSTKIGVVWQKSDFWTKNRNIGPKKRHTLFNPNHVLATTGKSCSKKKSAFAQIIKGGNVILGDFLG